MSPVRSTLHIRVVFAIHHKTPRLVLQKGIVRSTGEDCGQHRAWKLKQLLNMSFNSVNEKRKNINFAVLLKNSKL
jgi:hypothetical protein